MKRKTRILKAKFINVNGWNKFEKIRDSLEIVKQAMKLKVTLKMQNETKDKNRLKNSDLLSNS